MPETNGSSHQHASSAESQQILDRDANPLSFPQSSSGNVSIVTNEFNKFFICLTINLTFL